MFELQSEDCGVDVLYLALVHAGQNQFVDR